jgi:predicted ATPase
MGGSGKTTLALAIADRVAAAFPDGQLWIDLQGTPPSATSVAAPTSVAEAMAQVLHAFDREATLPEDESELAGAYRSQLHGRRLILHWITPPAPTRYSPCCRAPAAWPW